MHAQPHYHSSGSLPGSQLFPDFLLVNQGRIAQQFLLLYLRQGFQFALRCLVLQLRQLCILTRQCQLLFLLLQ